MIYIFGTSISVFLSILLFSKRKKIQADRILAFWLLVIGAHLFLFYLYFSNNYFNYPFLLGLEIPLPLIHGPFLYLYTAHLTNQLVSKKRWLWLHFIPVICLYIYLIKAFFFLPSSQKIFVFQHEGLGFKPFIQVNLILTIISGIVYVIWSLILLRRYKVIMLNEFSYEKKINLRWLRYLIYGISLIWLLIFTDDKFLFIGVVLFILFIGYFGIKQVGIFTNQKNPTLVTTKNTSIAIIGEDALETDNNQQLYNHFSILENDKLKKSKYSKSGLKKEMSDSLHHKLTQLMVIEKIYTKSELSLTELANILNTHPNYLSQVINEKEGKNFYDYINTFRILEFQRLISIPSNQQYTILSLCYDCGFNSKSSFNNYFKKITGQSPSLYILQLNSKKT